MERSVIERMEKSTIDDNKEELDRIVNRYFYDPKKRRVVIGSRQKGIISYLLKNNSSESYAIDVAVAEGIAENTAFHILEALSKRGVINKTYNNTDQSAEEKIEELKEKYGITKIKKINWLYSLN
jgi:hypothetical protein